MTDGIVQSEDRTRVKSRPGSESPTWVHRGADDITGRGHVTRRGGVSDRHRKLGSLTSCLEKRTRRFYRFCSPEPPSLFWFW